MSHDLDRSPLDGYHDRLAFETPTRVSVAYPEMVGADWDDWLWCSTCGGQSQPRPGNELWAVKHHAAGQPRGRIRFYCDEHLPAREWTPSEGGHDGRGRVGPLCPTCFTALPLTGVCDTCG